MIRQFVELFYLVIMIQSTGYQTDLVIYWELETHQFDFSPDEFDEMIRYMKTGNLFTLLEDTRPALLYQLKKIQLESPLRSDMEIAEWEYELEMALRSLSLRLRR